MLYKSKHATADLFGQFDWTGENKLSKAELVVSYGPATPWHQWVHRSHFSFPAAISEERASCEIPVLDPKLAVIVFGILTDENGAMVTTLPQVLQPAALGIRQGSLNNGVLNGFPQGDFEANDVTFFQRSGLPFGATDTAEKHTGQQSVRLAADQKVAFKLFHVPTRSHRLRLYLKTDQAADVSIQVRAIHPQNYHSDVVRLQRNPKETGKSAPPTFEMKATTTNRWQPFTLACPYAGESIAGYEMVITAPADRTCWIDTVRFKPES